MKRIPYGDSRRQGVVMGRSQAYNPKTDRWVKRDTETGRFMDQKTDKDHCKESGKKEEVHNYGKE